MMFRCWYWPLPRRILRACAHRVSAKLERDLVSQQRLQNRQDRKDSILEAERMKEAERLQKENEERSKMKSKAWKAGHPHGLQRQHASPRKRLVPDIRRIFARAGGAWRHILWGLGYG